MENKEIYRNYQKYTNKNQRLAIFGRGLKGKLEIFILICNAKDQFNKVFANFRYNKHILNILQTDCHPIIKIIKIEKEDSIKYTFDKFCKTNFYNKIKQTYRPMIEHDVLTCGDGVDISVKGSEKRIYKLGYK